MAISAKTRSRQVLIGEPDADGGLNDNNMHPGHELSDLRNVQRQPAGEAVVHYARFAQIPSFPDHPEAEPTASVPAPPMDAAVEKQGDEKAPVRRRVALTYICSLIFHATLAAVLLIAFPKAPEEAIEEAGQAMSVVMYGDSDIDQAAAGETETTIQQEIIPEEVQPDTIQPTQTAEVQPETVQPTEVSPFEAQDPIQQAPAPEVTRVSPETAAAVEPEILVSEVPAEESVAQPMSTVVPEQQQVPLDAVPPSEVQPTAVQPSEVQPAETPAEVAEETPQGVKPIETAEIQPKPEQPPEVVTPTPKPKVAQEKPKPVEKKRPPQKAAGDKGEGQQTSTRGVAEGNSSAQSDNSSQAANGNNGVGTAATANYKGKVRSRIRRAIRKPRGVEGSVVVTFSVNGGGGLTSARVSRGSGVPEIDQLALDAVRRAAPFSPPPGGQAMTMSAPIEIVP
ncbi:TonB family protein [Rhizobium leguminosarum]|uniref:TonB family protein n=1 Tax=Rhizobium leguminosarum bv. trifolii (strain WSM1325) TaxID=395491 RepID=C6AUE3_RHILS|nr:energy transducer TonB [Rhizobium leguminosarum]ACS57513.1 TonB family protein [Rhizobium leguminosarum bv. trifolii WSM1325]MBY2909428.1 TonB family protein [Rhizobium leguminosarum]MBY2949658.1 TonB family protein [Rhizobium leguminosarum]MBY2985471.1 TonB family protein [Rhizobium leguminosarum]MBY2990139.1 TonB family protein [Rhizobium leguminosarum]